jgi:NADP-dependent 3-hydroxy acid dehydrogenase YdfG
MEIQESVVLIARDTGRLREVVTALPQESRALAVGTDVSDEEEVKRLVERTIDRFGRIDILVNNAGHGLFKPVVEMTAEEFDEIIAVNLRGVFLMTRHVLPHMYARKHGMIITVSSLAGKNGFAGGSAYCASKFGVMGMMESIFHEARGNNVRVVTLCPGSVDTHFFDESGMTPPRRDSILQAEDVAETILFTAQLPDRALIREVDIRPADPKH